MEAKVFPYMIQGAAGQIGIIDNENKEIVIVCGCDTGIILRDIEVDGKEIAAIEYIRSLNINMGS